MSAILDAWREGRGLPDCLVIDGHVHPGEWPHGATFADIDEAAERSVAVMDANGVDAACCVSGGYMWTGTDYHLGNDFLMDLCARVPDRLIPFVHVNPNDTKANVLAELVRMHAAGARAIKLLNAYQENYPGDGPNLMATYEFAAEHNMIVFNHWWEPNVLRPIAERFAETIFIFGHYGSVQNEILKACPNVYANTWTVCPMGMLDDAFAEVGAGKFMMGSDGFMNPMSVGIGPVVHAPISDDEKRMILGLTVARLLDSVGALPPGLKARWREHAGP